MAKKSTVDMLWGFSRGSRRYFLLAILASLFSIVFSFLTPQVIRFTVDSIIGTEAMSLPVFAKSALDSLGGRNFLRDHLILCAAAIVVCAILSSVCSYGSRMGITKGTEGFAKSLRDKLFGHIQRLPFKWHTENQTGDIIQRCTSDVETLRAFVSAQLLDFMRTVLLIAVALWLMYSMNTTLAIINTAYIPLIVAYSAIFHGRISRQFRKADESEGELMVDVQENLTGVRVVRAFGRERYELKNFEEKNDAFAKSWIDLGYTTGFFWGIGDFASCCQMLTVICVGAYLAAKGQMTLGVMLVFISYTQTLSWPVRNLGRTVSEMSKASVSISRIREILDAEEEPEQPNAKRPDMKQEIEFRDVSFAYGENHVLKDVSFTIEPGSTFGILGSTGSGKSTITYLLNRLYDLPENSGSITIGGVDIRDIERHYLRKNVGLVLQEPFLFSKTVQENIAIAGGRPELESVRCSASIAAVDEDIMRFKDGYDTIVGERGVTLSGGQKQRIAIARTLMMDCPIMIFDDSMSAVDMETDAKIREALRSNTTNATVILISHRINTLMQADRVMVLDDGRVEEIGSPEELAKGGGIYARVYKLQSDAGLLDNGKEADSNG